METRPKRSAERVKHTIRSPDGGTKQVTLTRKTAIFAACTECMGFETHPKECTSKTCPLYPYRGLTRLAK